ncbi:MAG: aldo/keto reductase [Treponema sp.]|nr:aldo/keto reductase [Treponema sp.]
MEYVALGRTSLLVSSIAFGAMSLDCPEIEALGDGAGEYVCSLVRQAYEAGINLYDTSRTTPVSEKRLGNALHGIRENVLLATKSRGLDAEAVQRDVNASLDSLCTDYIDLFQIECSEAVPQKDGRDRIYRKLLDLQERGTIRHFGLVTEDLTLAEAAIESGLYESVQFPFNMIYTGYAEQLVTRCGEKDVGCIAMQPLNGGVLSNIPLAVGFFTQPNYENAVPAFGIHTAEELQQIVYFTDHPPVIDEKFEADIKLIRLQYN